MKNVLARMGVMLTALLMTFSLCILADTNSGIPEVSGLPGRSQTGFIAKDDFYLHAEYNRDNLWIVVWMENSQTYEAPERSGSDKFFFFREIANSFAFPVDGGSHMSGEKRRALAELFTATDCVYCPGAEGAFDTLVNERFPDDFSLIEWHRALNPGNDPYETGSSQGRFSSYNVTGTPTAIFDGTAVQVGGDTNPNNSKLPLDYGKKIDRANNEEPLVTFTGRASTSGDYLSFNVSFQVVNPMPRGNWVIRAAVCEDLQKEHSGAVMRHTPRGTVETKHLTDLQEGFPDAVIDEEATFSGVDRESVRGNFTIFWEASDAEDGNNVDIDIIIRPLLEGTWTPLVQGLENTGHYRWDTANPRTPDGTYQLRLIASDMSANSILSSNFIRFTIDNPDPPTGNFTYPLYGQSLSGRARITWISDDDEDGAQNLKVRISISNDSGASYRIISYNIADGSDWIVNMGAYDLNTLNYLDTDTYRLKLDLRDSDDMITVVESDMFEIYNNDPPSVTLISPVQDSTVTGSLDVGYRVSDQEDPPSAMWGNISFQKYGQERWTVLWEGLLDDEMTNKTFDTLELPGDGRYTLRFTVTDSRGLSAYSTREFNVYDPDAPVFTSVTGPANVEDWRGDELPISWECTDADEGETLEFNVYLSEADIENWTLMLEGISGSSASIPMSGLGEGFYRIKVEAVDSSPHHLSDEGFFGPFYYNAPDPPRILPAAPDTDGNLDLPEDVNDTLEKGFFILDIIWSVSDRDGDNVTSSVHYRKGEQGEWIKLTEGRDLWAYGFNMTELESGTYYIRITAVDDSPHHMSSEIVIGPVSWRNVFEETSSSHSDDDQEPTGEEASSRSGDELDWTLYITISAVAIVIVILLVLLVLLLVSRMRSKKVTDKVIPDQKDMDYSSIPEFQRSTAPQRQTPASQGAAGPTGPAQTAPEQEPPSVIQGSVKWSDDDEGEDRREGSDETVPTSGEEGIIAGNISKDIITGEDGNADLHDQEDTQTGIPEEEAGRIKDDVISPPPAPPS